MKATHKLKDILYHLRIYFVCVCILMSWYLCIGQLEGLDSLFHLWVLEIVSGCQACKQELLSMSHFIDLQFFLLWVESSVQDSHTFPISLWFRCYYQNTEKGRHYVPTRRRLRLMFSAWENNVFMLACLFSVHLAHLWMLWYLIWKEVPLPGRGLSSEPHSEFQLRYEIWALPDLT